MNSSSRTSRVLLFAAAVGFLAQAHAQISMAPPTSIRGLQTQLAALVPKGATDIKAEAKQAVLFRTARDKGVLLPIRYFATYKRQTPLTQPEVDPKKFYCGLAQQTNGQHAVLVATIGEDATADQECYGIKAIGTIKPGDASSLILIYDVGHLPSVSPSAVVLQWDEAQHRYGIDKDATTSVAEHLTTSTTVSNIRRYLATRQKP